MSTVLVNTDGGSFFRDSSDIINLGDGDNLLRSFGLSLNNVDKQPVLVPSRKVIDVVNDFSWYAGPKATPTALNKVPCVFLTEREQLLSSFISGAMYYLNAANRGINDLIQSDTIKSLLGTIAEESTIDTVQSTVQETFEKINAAIGGTDADRNLLAQNNLKSLEGIYFTKPTGFHYRLPMYNNSMGVNNSSGRDDTGNFMREAVAGAQNIVKSVADVVNITQPGTYIEPPKYFNKPDTVTEKVTFPLANTIRRSTVSPVQQNYELLWLLAFQNKPYKTSFTRTPPPKIYSVYVPGSFSMPYAYIKKMDVEFVGTTRKTSVTVPAGNGEGKIGSTVVQAPIPEAYQVTIEFASLVSDYGNTMLSDAFNPTINGNIVKVGR